MTANRLVAAQRLGQGVGKRKYKGHKETEGEMDVLLSLVTVIVSVGEYL